MSLYLSLHSDKHLNNLQRAPVDIGALLFYRLSMTIAKLIEKFSRLAVLPVDVNAVLAEIRAMGHQDCVEFIGVDIDADVMLGKIKVFHVRNGVYSDPERHANIYYHRGLEPFWQRMICCKELTHLLDPADTHTNNIGDIDQLAERIGLPPEMQDPLEDGPETNRDRLAEWRAAALLLPMAARELLMPAYREGKINTADVARLADIPSKYAAFVMSDNWPKVHELLLKAP